MTSYLQVGASWRSAVRSGLLASCAILLATGALPAADAILTDDGSVRLTRAGKAADGHAISLVVRHGRSAAAVLFDLSSLPEALSAGDVAGATLKLWISAVKKPGTLDLVLPEDDWDESSLPPRLSAGATPPLRSSIQIGPRRERTFLVVDVTEAVRGWLDGTAPNRGLALVASSPGTFITFDSKENTLGAHEPELQIVPRWGGGDSASTLSIVGPPGPEGPPGAVGPPGSPGSPGAALNPLRIAEKRWYKALGNGITAGTGLGPSGIVFDGRGFWVAAGTDGAITRHRLVDGALMATVAVGSGPDGMAFDGEHVWVANSTDGTVSRVRAADDSAQGTFTVGTSPRALAFDGASLWVANFGSDDVTRLDASTGSVTGTFGVGDGPMGIVHDGTDLWVTNSLDGTVSRLSDDDGSTVATYASGTSPHGIAFDGAHLWIADNAAGSIMKLDQADGTILATYAVGTSPTGVLFDGEDLWVVNSGSGSVSSLRPDDGLLHGSWSVGSGPHSIAFDGAHLWITNSLSDTVSKL